MIDVYQPANWQSVPTGELHREEQLVPAPHGRRLIAMVLDLAVLSLALGTAQAAAVIAGQNPDSSWYLSSTLWVGGYFILTTGLTGATLGKWLLGLMVVGPAGCRLSRFSGLFRSVIRYLVMTILAAFLGLTWWTALGRQDHRAIHDLAADTREVLAPQSGLEIIIRPPLRLIYRLRRR